MKKRILPVLLLMLFIYQLNGQDTEIIFPDDAGIIDVMKDPYYADNTGTTDATAAIQAALDAYPNGSRIIYLPHGTYLVSNTLKWPAGNPGATDYKRTILQGQSKDGSIIKLKDNCEGYQDPGNRKAVIYTGPAPAQRFRNAIRNLTVNTGTGNPGASGIQFNTSNEGTMQHIIIKSEDGQGVYGLDLAFANEIGPGLINDLTVEGFDIGVKHGFAINSMTFENITLRNQKVLAFDNDANVSTIRKLTSENHVTAINNNTTSACMVLLDAVLSGGDDDVPAVLNKGTLYIRNLSRSGYNITIQSTGGLGINMSDNIIAEYSSHGRLNLFPSPATMLNLDIKDVPQVPWSELSEWVNPISFGAVGDGTTNDTKAIQDAIDAGKETVYFPGGKQFRIDDTLYIRGEVRRIIGCEGRITGTGVIIFSEGTHDTVILERVNGLYNSVNLIHDASRTLIFHSSTGIDVDSYGTGDLFMCNIVIGHFFMHQPGQKIWCRHLNTENGDAVNVLNDGATLWLFGYKTERGNVKVKTINRGLTEILGVHNYSTSSAKVDPWFMVEDASLSIACARETNYNNYPYIDYVEETREGESKILKKDDCPMGGAGAGRVIPFFSGYKMDHEGPGAPQNVQAIQLSPGIYDITWNEPASGKAEYYSIYYTTISGGPYYMLFNYIKETAYQFHAKFPETFYFVVTTVDTADYESVLSDEIEIIVPDYGKPEPPSGLIAVPEGDDVELTWRASQEDFVSSYNIYRAMAPGVAFIPLASGITDTVFIDTTRVNTTGYHYVVSAVSIFNVISAYSNHAIVYPVSNKTFTGMSESGVLFYPNPANNQLYIEIPGNNEFRVDIYSTEGKLILSDYIYQSKTTLDMENIQPGIYILSVETDKGRTVRELIIKSF